MRHHMDKLWGMGCGIGGGMIKFLQVPTSVSFMIKLLEAGTAALVCGFLGAMGKHLYDVAVKKFKNKNDARII